MTHGTVAATNAKARKTAAYAYLRVSGGSQKHSDGFTRQRKAVEDFANKNDIKIKAVFREVVSGTTLPLDRPVFSQLLEALLSNGTRVVLVENLSRLARDLMVQESILSDFEKRGLQIVSVSEPDLGSDDPSRKFIRQVLGAFHEFEKRMIVKKLKVARERTKELRGRCEGNLPYGTKPGEAEILKRILADIKKPKYTANRIATELNRDGIKTRSGGSWYGSNVVRILRANRVMR